MAFDAESGAATGATVGTAFSPGVGTLLGAAAGGLIGLGVDTWSSDRSREKDQEDYQQNQLQNFMYGQEAQRNAASNEVAGLLKAGLNPALAAGANPASMVSAPMQNKEAPKFNPGVAQLLSGLRLQEAQTQNLEATSKKADAEAESIKIDNNNKKHRDALIGVYMDEELAQLQMLFQSDSKLSGLIGMLREMPKSEGALNAYEHVIQMLPKTYGARADLFEQNLRQRIAGYRDVISSSPSDQPDTLGQYKNEFLKSLITMDTTQQQKTIADMSKLYAETDNIKQVLELTKQQTEYTKEDIERIKALTQQVRNADIRSLVDNGEYGKALLMLLVGLFMGAPSGRK